MDVTKISKVILVGESNTGKSSFLDRILFNIKNLNTQPLGGLMEYKLPMKHSTIGTCFAAININKHCIHIWDTAGQERFRSLVPLYSRDSDVIIIMFDLNDDTTWEEVKIRWIDYVIDNFDFHCIHKNINKFELSLKKDDEDYNNEIYIDENEVCCCAPSVILLGNKTDLSNKVTDKGHTKELLKWCDINGKSEKYEALIKSIDYIPISVKTNENIDKVLDLIIKRMNERDQKKCFVAEEKCNKLQKNDNNCCVLM